jgi:protein ImuB
VICCLLRDPASSVSAPGVLVSVARACSPRVELHGEDIVVFDAAGLARVIGPPEDIAREVMRLAALRQIVVRVAIARTMTTAWILAHAQPGATVVASGGEAARLASVPLGWLGALPDLAAEGDPKKPRSRRRQAGHFRMAPGPGTRPNELAGVLATFERWGLRTLGDVAALPRADLHARLGPIGVRLHQAALGEDSAPLVPVSDAVRFVQRLELEWPIDGLEPLSFVLARQCDALSDQLERADRGAVTVTTSLRLVTRETHQRVLNLPAPMRDARVLRTLILLDLESNPPAAAIDIVEIDLGVTPGRIMQGALFAHTLPSVEDLATLVARLGALMGESRIGAPRLPDTHDERSTAMAPLRVSDPHALAAESRCCPLLARHSAAGATAGPTAGVLRRFRLPIAAQVTAERGAPVRVVPSARGLPGGRVRVCAGPWRTSGRWWVLDRTEWDRDEWDVEVVTGEVYRLTRDRTSGQWVIEGLLD